MFLPSGGKSAEDAAKRKATNQITRWVNEELQSVDADYVQGKYEVMVTEIQCNDPGCVPIETLVVMLLMNGETTVSNERSKRWADKILKPVIEVTQQDVRELVQDQFVVQPEADQNEIGVPKAPTVETTSPEIQITRVTMKPNVRAVTSQAERGFTPALLSAPLASSVTAQDATITRVVMRPNTASSSPSVSSSSAADTTQASAARAPPLLPMPPAAAPAVANNTATPITTTRPTTGPTTVASNPARPARPAPTLPPTITTTGAIASRHEKGSTRPRGCPCCDPDNLDNIVDQMMFARYPQT